MANLIPARPTGVERGKGCETLSGVGLVGARCHSASVVEFSNLNIITSNGPYELSPGIEWKGKGYEPTSLGCGGERKRYSC